MSFSEVGWDAFSAICIVAAIMLLTRPGSAGPDAVTAFTDGLSSIVGYAAGGLA